PDGWQRRVATHQSRRPARGLWHARRRRELAAPRRRPAGRAGVVDGQAPGDDGRCVRSARALLRHHQRRALDERRRGRFVALHRTPPARDLRGRDRRPGGVIDMKVLIPTPLLSYTGAREVEAEGETLAAVLSDLDRRYPGIRFRVVDEQGRLRRHIRFFAADGQILDVAHPLRADDTLVIVQALSGG